MVPCGLNKHKPFLNYTIKCDDLCALYATSQQWSSQLSGLTEKLHRTSQFPTWTKKQSWFLIGVWYQSGPQIVSECQRNHRRSILSKCIRHQGNCDKIWCKGKAQFSMPIPDLFWHNQDLNSWTYWAMKFALSTLLPTFSPSDCTFSSMATLFST